MIDFLITNGVYIVLAVGAIWLITITTGAYRTGSQYSKAYKKELAELEKNKCEGPHEWMKMDIMGQEDRVCKVCCWSQTHSTYVKRFYIDVELRAIEFDKGLGEYRFDKIKELSDELNVSITDILEIEKRIVKIREDYITVFTEESLLKQIEEIERQAGKKSE